MLLACLALAVASPSAREYRTVEVESLRLTIDSDWVMRSAPGYAPVRLDITNLGGARVIEIVGQGSRIFRPPRGGQGTTYLSQRVRLAPGDRVRLTIPVPVFADSEYIRFELREEGRTLERFNSTGLQSRVGAGDASVLLVAKAGSVFDPTADALARPAPSRATSIVRSSSGGTVTVTSTPAPTSAPSTRAGPMLDLVLEPERLPTNWLGFTSVRAVAIGTAEWQELTDGQRAALLAWTAGGGDLIVADGDLGALVPDARREVATTPDRTVARHFFGRVHVMSSAALASAGIADVLKAIDAERMPDTFWSLPANAAPDWGALEGRGFRLRIPGVEGIPARIYLGILLLFTLLIGPANYLFLRRRRQLVLLVLTVPAIAAVFIALLAGYAVVGEGFGVRGRAVTFTMLDQATRQAATRATVSMYAAGMTPGGLRIPRDVALYPIGPEGSGVRERLVLDMTDAQHFTGGVLAARSPANIEQVAVRAARERLTFTREAGGLAVTNGLDAPIRFLRYRDGDVLYELDAALAPGAQQQMKRLVAASAPPDSSVGHRLPASLELPAKFLPLVEHQEAGSYIAILERSPFWEPGVEDLVERDSVHVLLGWPEGRR
jgi:hypothetical protein